MLKIIFLPFLLFSISSIANATVMEIIPLYHRTAEDIKPILIPLLEGSEQVIANNSSLIIKATPARLEELKRLINNLDTPLNNLTITVIQSKTKTAEQLNASANIRLYTNRHNTSKLSGQIRGRFAQTEGLNQSDSTQVINTLEGRSATIKTGVTYPVQNINITNSGYGYPSISSNTQLIETSTGFIVTPRLSGDQVTLEITPWSDHLNNRGSIDSHGANTTIRVRLGEWVEIGGISENSQTTINGTLSHAYSTANNNLRLLIKVEKNQTSNIRPNPATFFKEQKWRR